MRIDIPVSDAERLLVQANGGLNLRDAPNGARLTAFFDGSFLTRTGTPVEGSDGFLWVPVRGTDTNDARVEGFVRIDFVTAYDPAFGDMDGTGRINPTLEADSIAEVKVRAGDTLSGIANSFGVSLADLIALNEDHIVDPDLIFPGDTVYLPDSAPPPPDEDDDRGGPPPPPPDDPVRPDPDDRVNPPTDCRPPAGWEISTQGNSAFSFNPATGRCESTPGARVFINRTEGYDALFTLTSGTVAFSDSIIRGDNIVFYADIGERSELNKSLFRGDITIDPRTGIGQIDERTSGTFKLGGTSVEFNTVEFQDDRMLFDVDLTLPGFLGGFEIDPGRLIFGPSGLRLEGQNRFIVPSDLRLENFARIPGLTLVTDDVSLSYRGPQGENAFRFQGRFEADLPGLPSLVYNFRDGKYIQLNANGSLDFVGQIDVVNESLRFKDAWGVRQVSAVFDTTRGEFGLSGELVNPWRLGSGIGAEIGFVAINDSLQLNKLGFQASDLNLPVPFLQPLFFQDIDVDVENFAAANPDPVTVTLSGRFTLGRQVSAETTLTEFQFRDVQIAFDGGFPSVSGNIEARFLEVRDTPLVELKGQFSGDDAFSVSGRLTSWKNIVTGSGSLTFDTGGNVSAVVSVQYNLEGFLTDVLGPVPGIGGLRNLLGSVAIGSAEAVFQVINDDISSNDFFAITVAPGFGPFRAPITIKFTQGSSNIPLLPVDLPFGINLLPGTRALDLIGSWDVPEALPWVQFTAAWETPDPGARLRVILPDGQVIDEEDFAGNGITLLEIFSTDTARSVGIETPVPGLYDIELLDETGLGEVRYFAETPATGPSLNYSAVTVNADGTVTIDYTAFDPDSVANISFWYDDDLTTFDGSYIGSALEADGPGSITWDARTTMPGEYFLYAVVEDENAPILIEPFEDFAISAGSAVDLAVSLTAPDVIDPGQRLPLEVLATNTTGDVARDAVLILDGAGIAPRSDLARALPPGSTIDGSQIRVPLGDLDPGAEVSLILRLTTLEDAREISVTASLVSTSPDMSGGTAVSAILTRVRQDAEPPEEPDPTGRIEGKVFVDTDANGIDTAEPGVGGVGVSLFNGDAAVAQTLTAANGFYAFAGLADGIYRVVFDDQVSGRVLIAPDQGTNDTRDSDAVDLGGGLSQITGIVVTDGSVSSDNDAGVAAGGLTGRVFRDTDGEGSGAGEPGLAGLLVELLDQSGAVIGAPAVTDSDGRYSFADLADGRYQARFTDTFTGFAPALPGSGPGQSDALPTDMPGVYLSAPVEVVAAGSSAEVDLGLLDPAGFGQVLFGTGEGERFDIATGPALIHARGGDDRIETGTGGDRISAGAGNDRVSTRSGDDIVIAGPGDDRVWTGSGEDLAIGGAGDDRIGGGRGDDLIAGGAGADRMAGGSGLDIFVYAPGDGADRVTDFDRTDLASSTRWDGLAGDGDGPLRGDRIDLTAFGFDSFGEVAGRIGTHSSGDALIDFDAGDTLRLSIRPEDLGEADFLL